MIIYADLEFETPYSFLIYCIDNELPEQWNNWKGKKKNIDLSGRHFEKKNFKSINLDYCNLVDGIFDDCLFGNTSFYYTILEKARFNRGIFDTKLHHTKLDHTFFYGIIVKLELVDCKLFATVFDEVSIITMNFNHCDFTGTQLTNFRYRHSSSEKLKLFIVILEVYFLKTCMLINW